jgi:2,3-bisphosphoglycerate-independent phosphoglycerate mutase
MNIFSFDYPRLKSLDSYENLREGLKKTCSFSIKVLKKNHKDADYAYIHIKETDLPGHDNKPIEKKIMIEYVDKTLFKFLREFVPPKKIKVVVTADHSTPSKLKAHSSDPVPVLFYNAKPPKTKGRITTFFQTASQKIPIYLRKNPEEKAKGEKFCEKNARRGSFGRIMGKELLEKVGFLR